MKILIVSDTHRKDNNLKRVLEKTAPLDMVIHLGDVEGSENVIAGWMEEGCSLQMVQGNNDYFSSLEREMEVQIGKYRTLLTHGHHYNVSIGVERLEKEARDRGFDIVMYGHTHRPFYQIRDGLVILNPGSLSYPRQDGRKPSFIIMDLDDQGTAHFTLNFFDNPYG